MEFVKCNLCNSTQYKTYLVRNDLNLFLDGEFQLVKCANCGLVYMNPRPTPDELSSLYPDEYDQYTVAVSDEPSRWTYFDRRYGLRKRCRSILRHKRQGRLLDIGCATGDFLDEMRHYPGWEVHGIELSKYASEYARSRLQLTVKTGTLDTVDYPEHSFDVITLWNVLEHLPDPLDTFKKVHRLLKTGGLLVFNTPNLDSLDARIFGPYWIGYELPRHLFIFSRYTLNLLVKKSGFSIVETRCLYGSHAAAMSSVRFWLRAKARNAKWRELLERVLFTRVFRLVTLPGFFIMDQLQLSTSLTMFCKKMD